MILIDKKNTRIDALDALRGFAVVLICLVHNFNHFSFKEFPPINIESNLLNSLDFHFYYIINYYAIGKGYALFALLFGITFSLQYQNYKKKNIDFGYRFLWRLILLAGFGLINSFFYSGDILVIYAILGISLFITRKFNDKIILVLAIFFLMQPLQWIEVFSPSFKDFTTDLTNNYNQTLCDLELLIKERNIIHIITNNITTLQVAKVSYILANPRSTQTLGLFFLGIILQRKNLFLKSHRNSRFWIYTLITSAFFIPSFMVPWKIIEKISEMWINLLFTFILASSFMLLLENAKLNNSLTWLKIYGRMSMTNYISQSFIGAIIYLPIGMHLATICNITLSVIVGIAIIVMQVFFSSRWFKKHKYGPLEGIWHKLTWIRSK